MMVALNGPGASDNGTTEWSLSAATGADNCTFSARAAWYAGPDREQPVRHETPECWHHLNGLELRRSQRP
jgi:hypothetical protein